MRSLHSSPPPSLHPTATPVAALTAHATESDVQRALRAGCDHCLTKPIDKTRLREAIDRWAAPPVS